MFDLRREDVLLDFHRLNDAITELEERGKMLSACLLQCPIKKIKPCKHNNTIEGLHEKVNCKKCKGTGYQVVFKE